ncbi:hypothetical protein Ndes2526B_g07026 [Nannochloris sp. 'desiccata']
MVSGTMPSCLLLSMSEEQSQCRAAQQHFSGSSIPRKHLLQSFKLNNCRALPLRISASAEAADVMCPAVAASEISPGRQFSQESTSSALKTFKLNTRQSLERSDIDPGTVLSSLWALAEWTPDPSPREDIQQAVLTATKSALRDAYLWPIGSLAATLEALGKISVKDTEILIPLVAEVTERAQKVVLDPLTTVKLFKGLSALQYRPPELLSALAASISLPGALDFLPASKLQCLIQSLSALDWPLGSDAVLALATVFSKYHRLMDASEVAEMAWVLARRGGAEENALAAFAPAVRAALPRCGMKQLADVSRAYSKVPTAGTQNGLFEAIAARAACCVDGAAPEDISRVIGAFDQVGMQPEALLEVVEQWADRRLAALSSQALALALASFAKLGNRSPRLLQTAATCVRNKLEEMQRSEIAMAVWAFARLSFDPGLEVLSHAERAVAAAPTAFSDREVANLLWALARLGYNPAADNLSLIAAGLLPVARKYSGISAALVLWAFATFSQQTSSRGGRFFRAQPPPPQQQLLCEALGFAVARELHTLDPQTLSLTAWAFGVLAYKHEIFTTECAALGSSQLNSFSPQNLANLGWGIAKSGAEPGSNFMQQYVLSVIDRLNEFSAPELFCVCWACATLRYPSASLGAAAAAELRDRPGEFGGLELSGMIWALARLLRPHQGATASWAQAEAMISNTSDNDFALQPALAASWILAAADRELPGKVDEMESTQLAMAVWGLGRLCEAAEITGKGEASNRYGLRSELKLPEATVKALHRALSSAIPSLNAASLISVLEGLSCFDIQNKKSNQSIWGGIFEASGERALALLRTLRPWEFPSLVFYLTCIGESSTAKVLLNSDIAVESATKTTPKGAILVLAAMARAKCCPEKVLLAARKRLSKLATSYRIDSWHLSTLYEALEALEPEQAQRIKLSKVWTGRMLAAQARCHRIKNKMNKQQYYL